MLGERALCTAHPQHSQHGALRDDAAEVMMALPLRMMLSSLLPQ